MPNLFQRNTCLSTYWKHLAVVVKFFVSFAILVTASSCADNAREEREVIADKISYDVQIKNPNPEYDWWIENLPGPQREELLLWIFKMAESGELPAYDYFNEKIAPEKIKTIGVDTIYRTLMRDEPPFEEYDTMIVTNLERKDITKVRFLERWYWNESKKGIEKEIIGIAPVLKKLDEKGNFMANFPLFWLYLDENYPEKK